jgi:hypothetical protein
LSRNFTASFITTVYSNLVVVGQFGKLGAILYAIEVWRLLEMR